jgi:enoyl-CoA hydratase
LIGQKCATPLMARFPQRCLRSDRLSAYEQWDMDMEAALHNETRRGMQVLQSGETLEGARRFAAGHGRHGSASDIQANTGSKIIPHLWVRRR